MTAAFMLVVFLVCVLVGATTARTSDVVRTLLVLVIVILILGLAGLVTLPTFHLTR